MKEKYFAVTPEGRTSFMNVFEKKIWEGETEGDYQVTMLFDNQSDLKTVQTAVNSALADEFGDNVPKSIEMPWKRGEDCTDKEGNIRDGYEGKIVVRTKSKFKPVILWPDTKAMTDLDSEEFQSGDYGKVKVEAKVWEYAGKRGVSLYLKVIQKTRTGERFGGDVDVSEFTPIAGSSGSAASGDLF